MKLSEEQMAELREKFELDADDKVMYIYNFKQVQFYIKKGLVPRGVYVNPKTMLASHIFGKKETEDAFKEWYEICKNRKISEQEKCCS